MSVLLRVLRLGGRRRLALAALLAFAVVASNVALLALAGWFIAAMAAAGIAGAAINYFTPAAGIRTFAIMRTLGRYLERLASHDETLRLLSRLRVWVYARIEPLSPAVLARYRRGDLLARLVADVDALDAIQLRIVIPAIVALAGTCGAVLFLAMTAPAVIPIELALLAVLGILLPALMRRLARRDDGAAVETAGELKGELAESLEGLSELTLFGALDGRRETLSRLSQRLGVARDRGQRLDAAALAAGVAVLGFAVWGTFVVAAERLSSPVGNVLYVPLLVFFVLASAEIVQGLPGALRALGETLAAGRRVFALADAEPAVRDPARPASLPRETLFEFRAVRFRHAGRGDWTLDGIDFELAPGKRLALVGPSGAGKSSVAGLLLRFWNCDEGEIRLGPRALGCYAGADVRSRIAYAAQVPHVFSTTLRENLLLGRPRASEAELFSALERARLAREIAGFPEGLDTFVGAGGAYLSAGQARRLVLARAFLKDAPVLLLDEPGEGLDPENERALIANLVTGTRERSLLLVTHRPVGLERMDEILVLDRGRVVQRGSHAGLLAEAGFYRTMNDYFAA